MNPRSARHEDWVDIPFTDDVIFCGGVNACCGKFPTHYIYGKLQWHRSCGVFASASQGLAWEWGVLEFAGSKASSFLQWAPVLGSLPTLA